MGTFRKPENERMRGKRPHGRSVQSSRDAGSENDLHVSAKLANVRRRRELSLAVVSLETALVVSQKCEGNGSRFVRISRKMSSFNRRDVLGDILEMCEW